MTQQDLAVALDKAVVTVARWETSRLPRPDEIATLLQFAIDRGATSAAAQLAAGFLRLLPLEKVTQGFAFFEREDQRSQPEGILLVFMRGKEQTAAGHAFYRAFFDLASSAQARRRKAAAALGPLLKAYLDSGGEGEQ